MLTFPTIRLPNCIFELPVNKQDTSKKEMHFKNSRVRNKESKNCGIFREKAILYPALKIWGKNVIMTTQYRAGFDRPMLIVVLIILKTWNKKL